MAASFSTNFNIITALFRKTNKLAVHLEGAPGCAKTALGKQVGNELGFDKVIIFFASLRDPVDLLGTPDNKGEVTRWVPPEELDQLRIGRNLFIIDEISDAPTPMQNALCGLIHERKLNNLTLSDETYIITTGNRTQDKSGANRMVTKLTNRVMCLDMEASIDDWADWAMDNHIDSLLIQFLRFKPALLADFDPARRSNATMRSWEYVSMLPADKMASDEFFTAVSGCVGEGAAAEYTAFRRVAAEMPDPAMILMDPERHPLPTKPEIKYALTGALAHMTSEDNIHRIMKFIDRMEVDFSVMYVKDVAKMVPKIRNTPTFREWANKNANVLMG